MKRHDELASRCWRDFCAVASGRRCRLVGDRMNVDVSFGVYAVSIIICVVVAGAALIRAREERLGRLDEMAEKLETQRALTVTALGRQVAADEAAQWQSVATAAERRVAALERELAEVRRNLNARYERALKSSARRWAP